MPDAPGVNAGMTFTILRGTEPLIQGEVEQAIIVERLRALARVAETLPPLAATTRDTLQDLASALRIGV